MAASRSRTALVLGGGAVAAIDDVIAEGVATRGAPLNLLGDDGLVAPHARGA